MSAQKEVVRVVEKFNLFDLIRKHIEELGIDESFFVTDVGDVVRKYQLWYELFPRIEPDFAIKCNGLAVVATTLAALGAGFDCASNSEIERVLAMGTPADKIVFAQTVKPIHAIKLAKEKKVYRMSFDNENELLKVKQHFPEAQLLLRLGFNNKTEGNIPFGAKFGCSYETGKELLRKAKELNLNVCGVAFHIGVGFDDNEIFRKAVRDSADMFEFGNSLGLKMDVFDIGGGFPGHETETITQVADVINSDIQKYFADPAIKIISEPGQFFASHCMTLVVNVHSKCVKVNEQGETVYHYYITDGVYQSFRMKLFPLVVKFLRDVSGLPLKKSVIWGRTCDPNDQVEDEIFLPEIECGEWIVLENFGSYRLTTGSGFNGFTPHPSFNYIDRATWETFKRLKVPNIDIDYEVIE